MCSSGIDITAGVEEEDDNDNRIEEIRTLTISKAAKEVEGEVIIGDEETVTPARKRMTSAAMRESLLELWKF